MFELSWLSEISVSTSFTGILPLLHPANKSTDYPNYYQGLWDCVADNPDELSFKRGDAIYILSKVRLGDPPDFLDICKM